ncbi:hypothetical protein ACFL0U_02625 [Pseudomonadota bacterium]
MEVREETLRDKLNRFAEEWDFELLYSIFRVKKEELRDGRKAKSFSVDGMEYRFTFDRDGNPENNGRGEVREVGESEDDWEEMNIGEFGHLVDVSELALEESSQREDQIKRDEELAISLQKEDQEQQIKEDEKFAKILAKENFSELSDGTREREDEISEEEIIAQQERELNYWKEEQQKKKSRSP